MASEATTSGDSVTIDRQAALPNICVFTGETTTKTIRCLFHWKTTPFNASVSPVGTAIKGLLFYMKEVPKASLLMPVSESIYRRRNIAVCLIAVTVIAAIATCVSLIVGQQWIDAMPKGPQKQQLNNLLIPAVAFGGFAIIAISALIANRLMPGLTTKLKVLEITDSHVRLSGACEAFRRAVEGRV